MLYCHNTPVDHGLTSEWLWTIYTLKDGELYYKRRPVWMFADGKYSAERICNRFNTRYAGKRVNPNAGTYKQTCVPLQDGSRVQAQVHNVIRCMETGEWPVTQVDHKNRNELDNRPCNIRLASASQQNMNRGRQRNNTSGVTGVCQDNRTGKWWAQIYVNGKRIKLKCDGSFDDAVAARRTGELKYFGEYRDKKQN